MFKKNFNAILVINGVLASFWKVFVKFGWYGQNTTLVYCFKSMKNLGLTLCSILRVDAACFQINSNQEKQCMFLTSKTFELHYPSIIRPLSRLELIWKQLALTLSKGQEISIANFLTLISSKNQKKFFLTLT